MELSFTESLHAEYCCIFVDGASMTIVLLMHIFCTLGINQVHINPSQCIQCMSAFDENLGAVSMPAMVSESVCPANICALLRRDRLLAICGGDSTDCGYNSTSIYNLFTE